MFSLPVCNYKIFFREEGGQVDLVSRTCSSNCNLITEFPIWSYKINTQLNKPSKG